MLTRDSGGPSAASRSRAEAPSWMAAISSTEGSFTTGSGITGVMGVMGASGSASAGNSRRRAEWLVEAVAPDPPPDPAPESPPANSGAEDVGGALGGASAFGSGLGGAGFTTFVPAAFDVL